MKRTNKAFIGILMAGYALLMIFIVLVGVNVYQGIVTEKNLDDEFAQIEYLIDTNGITDNTIDIKLNSYVSDGDYLDVEMAIKEYLRDLLFECRRLEDVYNNSQLNKVINLYNFDEDAPYFENSKKIIDEARINLEDIGNNLNALFDEDKIMSYAQNYDLEYYYLDYYKNSMIDYEIIDENKKDIDSSIDYGISMLNAYTEYFTFLSDNSAYWTMDEEYIYFDTDELVEEYNRLLDIINNMEFTTDIENYI